MPSSNTSRSPQSPPLPTLLLNSFLRGSSTALLFSLTCFPLTHRLLYSPQPHTIDKVCQSVSWSSANYVRHFPYRVKKSPMSAVYGGVFSQYLTMVRVQRLTFLYYPKNTRTRPIFSNHIIHEPPSLTFPTLHLAPIVIRLVLRLSVCLWRHGQLGARGRPGGVEPEGGEGEVFKDGDWEGEEGRDEHGLETVGGTAERLKKQTHILVVQSNNAIS